MNINSTTPSRFEAKRIERKPLTGKSGSKLRHQFVYMGTEEYVYKEAIARTDLSTGKKWVVPAIIRKRPIYRHITHFVNPTRNR